MPRLASRVRGLSLVALAVGAGCSRTYHPEYHPETRYSFVQNITVGDVENNARCKLGRVGECWRDCFERSHGEACYLLGVMFETGHGVRQNHEDAIRMSALAGKLGYAPASIDIDMAAPYLDLWSRAPRTPEPRPRGGSTGQGLAGSVTPTGPLIVYGSIGGDVYLGR